MRKLITVILPTVFVLTSLCLFGGYDAHGSTQSQDLAQEGRALLFNNGAITYSGILAANEKFKAAVAADAADQEAQFFYAASRIAASFLAEESGGLETFADVLHSFGMPRNGNDLVEEGPPFRDTMHLDGLPNFPETTPDGEASQAFLTGPGLSLAESALANLATINATFTLTLTAGELGQDHDLQIDYTDILLFRSFLESFTSAVLVAGAYNLDVSLRELAALVNFEKYGDFFSIRRDLLDKYPNALTLMPNGAHSLLEAKTAGVAAIKNFNQALETLQAETDDQSDDLFFFEEPGDLQEAVKVASRLEETSDSLAENRAAVFTYTEEEWIFTDSSGNQISLWVEKDENGQFAGGDFWGQNSCNFITCDGEIRAWTVSGQTVNITLSADCTGFSDGITATLTGTLTGPDTITGGIFTMTNTCGPGQSGTFTGFRQNVETETETMDFNRIFGNTGKPPANLRSILPEFDAFNEPVAGTFPPVNGPSPILNGFFPEILTNEDAARAFDLLPSAYRDVPVAAISIDGNFSDWNGVSPMYSDFAGDDDPDLPAMDMQTFYMAQDNSFYYFRMTLNEDLVINANQTPVYGFIARTEYDKDSWTVGDRVCVVRLQSPFVVAVVERKERWLQPNVTEVASYTGNTYARTGARAVEWKIPKQDMGNLSGKFVGAFAKMMESTQLSDIGETRIMLEPESVSGTVACSGCASSDFLISAVDDAGNVAGTAVTSGGAYTIDGLAAGRNYHLASFWDSDGNGIINNLDVFGQTGPLVIPEGGLEDADVIMDTVARGESTLSGTVECNGFTPGSGKIYVFVLNGDNPNEDGLIRTAALDGPGPFSFEGLNLSEEVWMFAYWDVNNSGGAGPDKTDIGLYPPGNPIPLSGTVTGIHLADDPHGDIDDSGFVDLADAILGLKAVAGFNENEYSLDADVDEDGRIGLPEVIYILQTVCGI